MDGRPFARGWPNAASGVDGRTGISLATGEAAGKAGMTESSPARAIKTTGAFTIRQCEALAEMQACFALQKEVWKFSDPDLIPVRMFAAAATTAEQEIGASI